MQAGFSRAERGRLAPLYDAVDVCRGMIEAGLSGMGRAWADNPVYPRSAVMAVGDFLLCAGVCGPEGSHQLRALLREEREWLVVAPAQWHHRMFSLEEHTRYAFDHEIQPEDEHLRQILRGIPQGMHFQPITPQWYDWCLRHEWSRDFVSLFSRENYAQAGLGVLLMQGDEPMAGASSYAVYPGGIEVQVQTREGFEGRGYGTLASAALILKAHEQKKRVTWDAHNAASARMAQKLGYRGMKAYTVFVQRKE